MRFISLKQKLIRKDCIGAITTKDTTVNFYSEDGNFFFSEELDSEEAVETLMADIGREELISFNGSEYYVNIGGRSFIRMDIIGAACVRDSSLVIFNEEGHVMFEIDFNTPVEALEELLSMIVDMRDTLDPKPTNIGVGQLYMNPPIKTVDFNDIKINYASNTATGHLSDQQQWQLLSQLTNNSLNFREDTDE